MNTDTVAKLRKQLAFEDYLFYPDSAFTRSFTYSETKRIIQIYNNRLCRDQETRKVVFDLLNNEDEANLIIATEILGEYAKKYEPDEFINS